MGPTEPKIWCPLLRWRRQYLRHPTLRRGDRFVDIKKWVGGRGRGRGGAILKTKKEETSEKFTAAVAALFTWLIHRVLLLYSAGGQPTFPSRFHVAFFCRVCPCSNIPSWVSNLTSLYPRLNSISWHSFDWTGWIQSSARLTSIIFMEPQPSNLQLFAHFIIVWFNCSWNAFNSTIQSQNHWTASQY